MPFVYLLRCADGSLYVGHTEDLASRENAHNDGHAAAYTAKRPPVRLAYAEEHASMRGAIARERQLKGWTAEKNAPVAWGPADTEDAQPTANGRAHGWLRSLGGISLRAAASIVLTINRTQNVAKRSLSPASM